MRGGHSGLEINEGRANANKLLVRFIREAVANYEARLASWEGGNMRNAIPREAHAVITIPAENEKELLGLVKYCEDLFNEEYSAIETPISFTAERVELPAGEVPDTYDSYCSGHGRDILQSCHNNDWRRQSGY